MGESTIKTWPCDFCFVGASHSLRLVNLLINDPYHLAVLSRRLPTTVIEIAVYRMVFAFTSNLTT